MGRAKGEVIRERYDATCMGYDELYGEEQREKYQAALDALGPPRGAVLDAGCGTALLAEFLHSRGLLGGVDLYVCLDYSGCMLSIAAGRLGRIMPGRHLIVEGNVEHLPFPDSAFDYVYSFTVLDLVDHPIRAAAELKRVARGPVVVSLLRRLPYKSLLLAGHEPLGVTSKDVLIRLA
ncbi:MAG: methyltransferase domain-containing protein [Desulfurococcales archaeon]|nr:methyltransferase domain-containing protein [Desulfurococcales archaeon]